MSDDIIGKVCFIATMIRLHYEGVGVREIARRLEMPEISRSLILRILREYCREYDARLKNRECFARFRGGRGWPHDDSARASEIFSLDHEYRIVGGIVERSFTKIQLDGVEGAWSASLFRFEREEAPLHHPWSFAKRLVTETHPSWIPSSADL